MNRIANKLINQSKTGGCSSGKGAYPALSVAEIGKAIGRKSKSKPLVSTKNAAENNPKRLGLLAKKPEERLRKS